MKCSDLEGRTEYMTTTELELPITAVVCWRGEERTVESGVLSSKGRTIILRGNRRQFCQFRKKAWIRVESPSP